MNQEGKKKKSFIYRYWKPNKSHDPAQKSFSEKFVSGIKSTSHYFKYVWYVLILKNVYTKYFSLFSWNDPKVKKLFSITQILAFPA